MRTNQKSLLFVALFACAWAIGASGHASVIDLRNLSGNFEQSTFGWSNTVIYAQSVIADNLFMNEARARLHATNGTLQFNFMVTGDRSDGGGGLGFAPDFADVRFNSGQRNLSSTQPLTEFTVNPNINVTPGERLFLVFDSLSYPTSGAGTMWGTQYAAAIDPYPAGEFVYFNRTTENTFAEVNTKNWEHRSANLQDLAILASFVAPEPQSCLLAVIGLVILPVGMAGRRRRV